MSGDADNAHLWADADVYVAFDLDATIPADESTEFGADWDLVGLLNGDDGFVESREEDKTDHYAWGGLLMKTGRRHHKTTKKFTAFEDNATTQRLRWPGSSGSSLKVPRPESVLIAFETREGTDVRRVISKYRAEVELDGDVKEDEANPAALAFIATIFPDSDGVIWTVQPALESTGS